MMSHLPQKKDCRIDFLEGGKKELDGLVSVGGSLGELKKCKIERKQQSTSYDKISLGKQMNPECDIVYELGSIFPQNFNGVEESLKIHGDLKEIIKKQYIKQVQRQKQLNECQNVLLNSDEQNEIDKRLLRLILQKSEKIQKDQRKSMSAIANNWAAEQIDQIEGFLAKDIGCRKVSKLLNANQNSLLSTKLLEEQRFYKSSLSNSNNGYDKSKNTMSYERTLKETSALLEYCYEQKEESLLIRLEIKGNGNMVIESLVTDSFLKQGKRFFVESIEVLFEYLKEEVESEQTNLTNIFQKKGDNLILKFHRHFGNVIKVPVLKCNANGLTNDQILSHFGELQSFKEVLFGSIRSLRQANQKQMFHLFQQFSLREQKLHQKIKGFIEDTDSKIIARLEKQLSQAIDQFRTRLQGKLKRMCQFFQGVCQQHAPSLLVAEEVLREHQKKIQLLSDRLVDARHALEMREQNCSRILQRLAEQQKISNRNHQMQFRSMNAHIKRLWENVQKLSDVKVNKGECFLQDFPPKQWQTAEQRQEEELIQIAKPWYDSCGQGDQQLTGEAVKSELVQVKQNWMARKRLSAFEQLAGK